MNKKKQIKVLGCVLLWSWLGSGSAVPVAFYNSFAGNYDYVVTGGSLRTGDANPCQVNNNDTATLSAIPASAGVVSAFLYWAGSGNTPDYTITFDGNVTSADRTFTETVTTRSWFGGFADVTAVVQNKAGGPNGTYSFAGLTVDTGGEHCTVATVLSGWSLVVIYEDAAEPLRVLNFYDGLENFWGDFITFTPANFRIPNSGIDGRFSVLTWEGDIGNSTPLNGRNEELLFNGLVLTDALNPAQNQYNSTINTLGVNNSYGVDLDSYDISSTLSPGDTSATTFYSTGQDRVLLTLQIISVTNTPISDLAISKTHNSDFVAGQPGIYSIGVSNNGPLSETGPITVTDTLPAGLSFVSGTGTGWSCGAIGQDVTCTRTGALASGAGAADITLTVNVAAAAAPSVTNTASVTGTNFDNVAANNSAGDPTTVLIPDLSTSIKTVVDLNGGDADPGDTLRYTVTLNETGGAAVTGVSVTDAIDALLNNFSVISVPAGATNNSIAGTGPLDISNINITANGSVDIVFDATIAGTANPGDAINNTAVIANPVNSVVTDATAPSVIVSESSIPASGIKNLYPYFTGTFANQLRRVVPVANTQSALINGLGGTLTMNMSPSTQSSLTLGAGNIQVPLCIRRQGGFNQTRIVNVALSYVSTGPGGSAGPIGNQTVTQTLGNTNWSQFTFNINLGANVTLNPNTAIRMVVTNNSTFNANRQIQIQSLPTQNCTTNSRISLNADTVINVDSVDVYDAVYPGGVIQPSYVPGSTVFIRSVISDPFGSFDINNADIEIIDTMGATVQASTPMTQVNDSGVASRTYEYQYTIPGVVAEGNWTARVTANEGTEGTISDLGVGTFLVGSPSISMLKLVSTISDPVNAGSNPKSIPGAIVEFQISASNSGYGPADADSVVIGDAISGDLQLLLGNPADPIQLIDGSPASGLSFTFIDLANTTDDVDFSNDGGSTFVTPASDIDGFDITVPPVNFIRITPNGRFNGSTGSGDPNFAIRFRARVR